MNKRVFFSIILILVLYGNLVKGGKPANPVTRIGLVGSLMSANELQKIESLLKTFENTSYEVLSVEDLCKIKNEQFSHIWIHKTQVAEPTEAEIVCGDAIRSFVQKGGNLFVSREALNLLNAWGFEKQPFQCETDTIRDEGFGRPLGFHAFKTHPLFEGLQHGAYVSKAINDHVVRKIGFFNDRVPENGTVVGIEWTYITFHENSKLLLEYNVGKGKIIAAGAFLDYELPNYNQLQLQKFTSNVFRYTSGTITGIKKYNWDYTPQIVTELPEKSKQRKITNAPAWKIPDLSMSLNRKEDGSNFVNLAGRRILIMGKEKGGIDEIWVHPFMALRDFQTEIRLKNQDEPLRLNDLIPQITVSPEMIIREYLIGNSTVKEIITNSFDKPIALIHYEWTGDQIDKIVVKYTSNLRYMWPYSSQATQSLEYERLAGLNGWIISGQKGELNTMVSFNAAPESHLIGQYDSIQFKNNRLNGKQTSRIQVHGGFVFDASQMNTRSLDVSIVAGSESKDETIGLFRSESRYFSQLFKKTSDYYQSLLKNSLVIQSPDPVFNEAYNWAILRTDQFLQETPGIGTSLMAGFGTTARGWNGRHPISGRPGYAWYFGRDAQWSGMAISDYGDFEMVKKILTVFDRYMDVNGKIYHELTSSGAVHYDASDASPLYLVLAAHYLKQSGDLNFIQNLWPGLKKTWDYVLSTDTDGDGLIENTNVGHGWIEGGNLYGTHTEFYLAACQVAAANAMSYMADAMKDNGLIESSKIVATNTLKIIDQDFWNKSQSYFNNGKMKDGSYMPDKTSLASVGVYLNAVGDQEKAFKVASELSRNEYSTDWGLRIISEFNRNYNPRAYHEGMVWPLFTGWGSLAEYASGCYTSGYMHLMQNMNNYRQWALGCMPETLNGQTFTPGGVCPLQCWSETMILQSAIEGLLGLNSNALNNELTLSPRFPWDWNSAFVSNIRLNNTRISLKMEKGTSETTFIFTRNGNSVKLDFSPSFPLFTEIKSVTINGRSVPFKILEQPESIRLLLDTIDFTDEKMTLSVFHEGGRAILAPTMYPVPGKETSGIKVLSQKRIGSNLLVIVEGKPGTTYQLKLFSHDKIEEVAGGNISSGQGDVKIIETKLPESSEKYIQKELIIN